MNHRPFRFGAIEFTIPDNSDHFHERLQQIEAYGYSTIAAVDHLTHAGSGVGDMAPITMMASAAALTSMRVSCWVFCNDFRHPVVVAKEMATLDVISNGRVEFGIGAGWSREEYDRAGISYDRPGVRVSRMMEAARVIKGLWGPEPVTLDGKHYQIDGFNGLPKPIQQPHPPLLIGASGPRMLRFAAQEADIISIATRTRPSGTLDAEDFYVEKFRSKAEFIREAAGDRFEQIELALIVFFVEITDNREESTAALAERQTAARRDGSFVTAEQLLSSPLHQIGTIDEIVEDLQRLRDEVGFSYVAVFPRAIDAFAPVVKRLAGT